MKNLLLAVFIGMSSVSAATDTTLSEPLEVPAIDEVLVKLEKGQALSNQDEYDASISIFQELAQDTHVQQRRHILYSVLFYLATNYECMFLRELGTLEQQRGNINKAIEYFEQIIREIGALPDYEYMLIRSNPRLLLAQQKKAEFDLEHPSLK